MVDKTSKSSRRVLLLGEGNFSYALARARLFVSIPDKNQTLHLVATSFDSEIELAAKYPECQGILNKLTALAKENNNFLQVNVGHRVDATKIKETLPPIIDHSLPFDEITFCHPHIGSEDLRRNSSLLAHFLHSAKSLNPKIIQFTLLDGQFNRWQVN